MDNYWVYLQLRHPPLLLVLVDKIQLFVILPLCLVIMY